MTNNDVEMQHILDCFEHNRRKIYKIMNIMNISHVRACYTVRETDIKQNFSPLDLHWTLLGLPKATLEFDDLL